MATEIIDIRYNIGNLSQHGEPSVDDINRYEGLLLDAVQAAHPGADIRIHGQRAEGIEPRQYCCEDNDHREAAWAAFCES